MGPGKADLLDAVAREGSISAAARSLSMSYRRAWVLVDQMNRCFTRPLVETHAGGGRQAGARLTTEGEAALRSYRELSAQVEQGAQGAAFRALDEALRERPLPARGGD